MDMRQLIEQARATADCTVRPLAGIPAVRPGEALPEDVRKFYELCAGSLDSPALPCHNAFQ